MTMFVAADGTSTQSVYVFSRSSSALNVQWSQQQVLSISTTNAGFGYSVAINGNLGLVGANTDGNQHKYFFQSSPHLHYHPFFCI